MLLCAHAKRVSVSHMQNLFILIPCLFCILGDFFLRNFFVQCFIPEILSAQEYQHLESLATISEPCGSFCKEGPPTVLGFCCKDILTPLGEGKVR